MFGQIVSFCVLAALEGKSAPTIVTCSAARRSTLGYEGRSSRPSPLVKADKLLLAFYRDGYPAPKASVYFSSSC